MTKGDRTRDAILDEAIDLASVVGLEGLSIGELAHRTGLSKSGLFAHFGSKETLQVEVLRAGFGRFADTVVRPALDAPRGLARVRALFDGWLEWTTYCMSGGCLMVAASVELDDRQGPARDYLVETQREWLQFLAGAAERATRTGEFRADLDHEQFAHEFNSILLGYNQARRLLRDPVAETRARRAFERLIEDAKP